MSEKRYYAFGKLLTEGLNFVAWQEAQRGQEKKNLGRTRAQVAGEVGYSSGTFSGWERGERLPEPKIIRELAKRFIKTKRVDRKWLQDFLTKGEYGARQHIRALVDELFGNLYQGLIPLEFQSLVAEKTEGFVGRKHVFEAIARFLAAEDNGYLIIQAVPGMGKTTLLAEYAKQKGCIVYFNRSGYGQNRPDQFLESICGQLIERYGLPYPVPRPHKDTQDGVFLNKLLNEIGPRLKPDKPLIIAVDALDEVDLTGHKPGQNILFLPPTLPNGVYFVLTQRPLKDLPFRVDTSYLFDLMKHAQQNRADAQIYIQRTVEQSPQLQDWLKGQGLEPEEFGSRLAEKSEDNFMYLRYVLPEIESGFYQTLEIEQLPNGLEQYYTQQGHRLNFSKSKKFL